MAARARSTATAAKAPPTLDGAASEASWVALQLDAVRAVSKAVMDIRDGYITISDREDESWVISILLAWLADNSTKVKGRADELEKRLRALTKSEAA